MLKYTTTLPTRVESQRRFDEYKVWVKEECFEFCILTQASTRLKTKFLKRLYPYIKVKGSRDYPQLSFALWTYIATNKLSLSVDVAWMYFSTFSLLTTTSKQEWNISCHKYHQNDMAYLETVKVDALKFIIFLYIQQFEPEAYKWKMHNASTYSLEEWPSSSDSKSSKTSHGIDNTKLKEYSYISLIQEHLEYIINLFDEDSGEGDTLHRNKKLKLEVVKALELLIGASNKQNEVIPLHQIVKIKENAHILKYNQDKSMLDRISFIGWITKSLAPGPFGLEACLKKGNHISWSTGVNCPQLRFNNKKKISANVQVAPKGYRKIVMSKICHQTLASASSHLKGTDVKIHRSHSSFMYLCHTLRFVSIDKCHNSTVVLGPVQRILHVQNCKDTVIIAICRQVIIRECVNCIFHISTPNKPLLLGNKNENLLFAPYNTFYPLLELHLQQAEMDIRGDKWGSPICYDMVKSERSASSSYKIMEPERFSNFVIPLDMEGSTTANPVPLPKEYEMVVSHRLNEFNKWQEYVSQSNLTPDQQQMLREITKKKFQMWVEVSYHQREINGLHSLEKTIMEMKKAKVKSNTTI